VTDWYIDGSNQSMHQNNQEFRQDE
jgi:hypothetical protein